MIKRINKATSLLIAAAAVMSIIPATGVSAATKLETKDGTIESAIAFNGGKYIYNGYKTQDDATSVYYNAGDTDKQLEDFSADSMTKYGANYAQVMNGSDEYLVDLSTGTVSDQTTADIIDTAKTKLKTTLSKTDRYGKIDSTDKFTKFDQVAQGQFGDVWYSYSVTTSGAATLNGYVNTAGKYVDTDVTANMYVSTGTKTVKIDEFGKLDTDNNIKVDLVSAKTIAEDTDYIYRIANVNVTNATTTSAATYVQKISKAQGSDKDGAYLPNSVTSYEVSSAYDSSDATDAATTINDTNAEFRVINGVLYATDKTANKVTVTTIKLKKDKVSLATDTTNNKLDVYLAEQDVQKDQDITSTEAVSIDADGNTWAIYKGEILKFDGTAFTTVYDCDRSFDTLEVYNADSLIAWENGQDGYVTVNKKATETPVETPVQTTTGWVNTASGWTFFNAAGSQVKGQWVNDGGVWYMIKADGIMATGWYNDNGTWYFLNASGAMKTGWVNDNGTWYFLQSSGAMKTGWLNDNGTWYYLNASGSMAANTTVDGYKLNASGAWVK